MTVTDNKEASASTTQTVTVTRPNQPPVAAFDWSANYLTVNFNADRSFDPDGGSISSYSWNFGDQSSGTGKIVSKTYSAPGSYNVVLTVTDNLGASSSWSSQVNVVANNPPVASFTTLINSLTVDFTSTSTDADGEITSYLWDLGNGVTNTNRQFSYSYSAAGSYTVRLTVTDNAGSSATVSQVVSLTRQSQAPVCGINSCNVRFLQVTCNSNSTDDVGITNYKWDWDNGLSSTGPSLQNAQHTYTSPNTYNIQLTVTDA